MKNIIGFSKILYWPEFEIKNW